jgi:hypothetical protein
MQPAVPASVLQRPLAKPPTNALRVQFGATASLAGLWRRAESSQQ